MRPVEHVHSEAVNPNEDQISGGCHPSQHFPSTCILESSHQPVVLQTQNPQEGVQFTCRSESESEKAGLPHLFLTNRDWPAVRASRPNRNCQFQRAWDYPELESRSQGTRLLNEAPRARGALGNFRPHSYPA